MKKILFSMVILSILLLTGCTTTNKTIECSDFSCFKEAARDCSHAKGSVTTEISFFPPIIMSSTQSYEMLQDKDACKLIVTQENYEITTSDDSEVPPEMSTGLEFIETIIGETGECIYSIEEMYKLFSEWDEGTLSTEQTARCTGDLFTPRIMEG